MTSCSFMCLVCGFASLLPFLCPGEVRHLAGNEFSLCKEYANKIAIIQIDFNHSKTLSQRGAIDFWRDNQGAGA